RVDVVSTYDKVVRSPSLEFRLPSVVSLKAYVDQDRPPAVTRFNVFLRDGFSCVDCASSQDLTFDHVAPRCKGGRTTCETTAAACAPCSPRHGGPPPDKAGMPMRRRSPRRPSSHEFGGRGRRFPPHYLHQSWLDYLSRDIELEP